MWTGSTPPGDADGNYNFEALECIDLEKFNGDMNRLLAGERVELPRFNFKTGKREYKGDFLTMGPHDILVIEGIHCLNDRMSAELPTQNKYKIYISALTQLNVDEHNRIPTTDGRLLRRIVRDARTRGQLGPGDHPHVALGCAGGRRRIFSPTRRRRT